MENKDYSIENDVRKQYLERKIDEQHNTIELLYEEIKSLREINEELKNAKWKGFSGLYEGTEIWSSGFVKRIKKAEAEKGCKKT